MSGLRPIGEIIAELIPKLVIRSVLNQAIGAASPSAAVKAFMTADNLRRQAGLSWAQALSDINNRRNRGAI